MYNKDLLVQAGLDPDSPPRTWEEVVEVARAVRTRTSAYGYTPRGPDRGRLEDVGGADL